MADLPLDLSSLEAVRRFANGWAEQHVVPLDRAGQRQRRDDRPARSVTAIASAALVTANIPESRVVVTASQSASTRMV